MKPQNTRFIIEKILSEHENKSETINSNDIKDFKFLLWCLDNRNKIESLFSCPEHNPLSDTSDVI